MERPSNDTLIRYFRGQCSAHEAVAVELFLAMDIERELVAECMKSAWLDEHSDSHEISNADLIDFKKSFFVRQARLSPVPALQKPGGRKIWPQGFSLWLKIAATLLIALASSLIIYNRSDLTGERKVAKTEILPAGAKATLTLADGSTVFLAQAPVGKLAVQGGAEIEKTASGEVSYHSSEKTGQTDRISINTITTPRGGQYRITLPDGTKAWLNAASSLSYPVNFQTKERRVKMTGEVYFEVAKSILPGGKRIPFFVENDKQEIQVLGTHFNVNAYGDEPAVKTTLLEGSVKIISRNKETALLRPGQLALLTGHIQVKNADIDQELAWKNGDFIFKGETLESSLRQISRWYDVDVKCPPHLGRLRFNGMISRSQPLSIIVETIQLTKLVKVTLKERRLIVTD